MEVLETTLNRIPYNAYTDKTVFSCGDFANLLRQFLFFLTRFVAESLPPPLPPAKFTQGILRRNSVFVNMWSFDPSSLVNWR